MHFFGSFDINIALVKAIVCQFWAVRHIAQFYSWFTLPEQKMIDVEFDMLFQM